MPAQPPFFTPTRTPANGLSAFAMIALMRSAAASVSRITWGRGRAVAMFQAVLISGESKISETPTLSIWALGSVAATSPHVQRGARLVRHPALLPRRIPHDVDGHWADARDARHRVLHHDGKLLGRRTVRRGQSHIDS